MAPIKPFGTTFPAAQKLIFDCYSHYHEDPSHFSQIWDLSRLRNLKLLWTDLWPFLKYATLDRLMGLRSLTLAGGLPGLQYQDGDKKRAWLKGPVSRMFERFENLEKLVLVDEWEFYFEIDAIGLNSHTSRKLRFGEYLCRKCFPLNRLQQVQATCPDLEKLVLNMDIRMGEEVSLRCT
jgi:hypothetical protein